MPLDTIFTVRNEHLGKLSADEAVRFFADLLRAEARRLGLPVTSVNISSRTNVPDGGVDASIASPVPPDSGLASTGSSVFQLKSGDFKPWQSAVINDELFGHGRPATKESLGAPVRACMDASGKYVLVCTGADLTDPQRSDSISLLRGAFINCGYHDPQVDVLSQNQIIALLQSLPSLSLAINGNGGGPFETFYRWASHDQMGLPFKPGPPQTHIVSGLATELRKHDAAIHVHVRGEPGIGKTRLVLEALRHDDLAPLVIYCDSPAKIRDSELFFALLRDDNPFSVILVVDECDSDTRAVLWNKLKHAGPRVKFVSLFSDFDDTSGNTTYITAPPLESANIIEILKEYLPAAESANRWADFCSGSPRVAHVVGLNLKHNPDDLLKSPDTTRIWDRYIVGGDQPGSPQVLQRVTVLRRLALFKRFGFGSAVIDEAKAIAALCAQDDASITWARFEAIVHELRARKILQGEQTLYLTPKLLHVKLWVDWWDVHGASFVLDELAKAVPSRLLDWFFEMARYAEASKAAHRVFATLLDEHGPFQQSGLLTDRRGARFFLALTEAAPSAALQSLKNTVGTWSHDDLLKFATGRREIVWALERIVVWRDLFSDAARLLLKLAEAENEKHISNNATGVFAGLFSPGQGPVAPTEASPEDRFPILVATVTHESKECRRIGLLACGHALQTGHFSRMVGAEHQGLRRQPQLWMPATWGELFDAYRRVWQLLVNRLDQMPVDERDQALEVLLSSARGLAHMANLSEMVTHTLMELASRPYVDRRRIIAVVETVLHYDGKGMPPDRLEPWVTLQKSLVSGDFRSLMLRYVGMDLLEDKFDDDGKHADKVQPQVDALAQQIADNPALLDPELTWLVTEEARNGHGFGYSLGHRDVGFSLLPRILEAQRSAPLAVNTFLGGYVRALKERSEEQWEAQMDLLSTDPILRRHIPELTWRSGLTDRAAARILALAEAGAIEEHTFRFYSYGGVIRQLSEARFAEWLEYLLSTGTYTAAVSAVDLCHFYYLLGENPPPMPEDLVYRVLSAPALFHPADERRNSTQDDYDWAEVGCAYVEQHPQRSVDLAALMLAHFREEGTILGAFNSQTDRVLDSIFSSARVDMWPVIAGYLGPPIDSRAFHIYHWLRDGALAMFPSETVWNWVDEDVERRAWYVAVFVPQVFPGDPTSISAREILVRYGSRKDVRDSLMANLSTEMWSGPESRHWQRKLETLSTWKKGETNEYVLMWLNDYTSSIESRLELAKVDEERLF